MIGSPEIKRFSKIKFLGVLIDKKNHGKPMSSHLQKSYLVAKETLIKLQIQYPKIYILICTIHYLKATLHTA